MAWRKFTKENVERVKDEPGLYFFRHSFIRIRDQYYGMTYRRGLRRRLLDHLNAKPGQHDYLMGWSLEFDVEYCVGWSEAEIEERERFYIEKYQPWQNIQHHPKGHSWW